MRPKVSIVIPVYNRFELLQETVGSILNQDLGDFEIILVDDNSPDGTGERLSELTDHRIRFHRNTESKGAGATRNIGLRLAVGEYVAFSDQDDIWATDKLSEQVNYLNANPKCAIVGSWIQEFTAENGIERLLVLHRLFESSPQNEEFLIYTSPFVTCSAVMIRKRILDENELCFREDMGKSTCEDYDLWHRISLHGELGIIPKPLLRYRIHATQESRLASGAMKEKSDLVRKDILRQRGIELNEREFGAVVSMAVWEDDVSLENLDAACKMVSKITKAARAKSNGSERVKFHYHLLAMHINRSRVSKMLKLCTWCRYGLVSATSLGTKLHCIKRILRSE